MDAKTLIDQSARAIINQFGDNETIVYGLDTECNWGENSVRLLQVSFLALSGKQQQVQLFDLNAVGIFNPEHVPQGLRRILLMTNLIPTGRAIGTYITKIRKVFDIAIKHGLSYVDLL